MHMMLRVGNGAWSLFRCVCVCVCLQRPFPVLGFRNALHQPEPCIRLHTPLRSQAARAPHRGRPQRHSPPGRRDKRQAAGLVRVLAISRRAEPACHKRARQLRAIARTLARDADAWP